MDLSTTYMGLALASPFVVGASPLSDDLDAIRRAEDAGASAVVMHSLFMEQVLREQLAELHHVSVHQDSYAEALSYYPATEHMTLGPQEYLEQIRRLKATVDIPVIASLNGSTAGYWTHYAGKLQAAGADGIELNVYHLPFDPEVCGGDVEQLHLDILRAVKDQLQIPVAMKIGYLLSSPVHFARRLSEAGADGIVVFNRIFHPDIDIDELELRPTLRLSHPGILRLRLLCLAAMFGQVDTSLICSGGIQTPTDVIKAVMAGANAVQMTSVLLSEGPGHIAHLQTELVRWMEEREYESVSQMHGSMSRMRCPDPQGYERSNYLRTLQVWDQEH